MEAESPEAWGAEWAVRHGLGRRQSRGPDPGGISSWGGQQWPKRLAPQEQSHQGGITGDGSMGGPSPSFPPCTHTAVAVCAGWLQLGMVQGQAGAMRSSQVRSLGKVISAAPDTATLSATGVNPRRKVRGRATAWARLSRVHQDTQMGSTARTYHSSRSFHHPAVLKGSPGHQASPWGGGRARETSPWVRVQISRVHGQAWAQLGPSCRAEQCSSSTAGKGLRAQS